MLRLYEFVVFKVAMKAFTASGCVNGACFCRKISVFLVNCIVVSLLLSIFIWIKRLGIVLVFGKMGLVCWS